jgi:hypothetical protein
MAGSSRPDRALAKPSREAAKTAERVMAAGALGIVEAKRKLWGNWGK